MPAKYINSFSIVGQPLPTTKYVFAWSDTPGEDPDFLVYLNATLPYGTDYELRNEAVDRSGAQPQVTWEMWKISTNTLYETGAEALSTGIATYRGFNGRLTSYDPTGHWDSDQYGRPFNLNDLLA